VAKAPFQCGRQNAAECVYHFLRAQRLTDNAPNDPLILAQMTDVFWKQIDFHARMRAVGEIAVAASPMHRTIVARGRYRIEHDGVESCGKDILELEMAERLLLDPGSADRSHNEFNQLASFSLSIRLSKMRDLVHASRL
jgi:hypothetical protein